jgi:hypothetical protein
VAVVLTLVQTKQIRINIQKQNNTKSTVQEIQNTVNTSIHKYYQNTQWCRWWMRNVHDAWIMHVTNEWYTWWMNEVSDESSRRPLTSYTWDRSQVIPRDSELALGMFFSDYFVFLCCNHSTSASHSFMQLFLTPYNLNWTAQIGQALYRDLYERFLQTLMWY